MILISRVKENRMRNCVMSYSLMPLPSLEKSKKLPKKYSLGRMNGSRVLHDAVPLKSSELPQGNSENRYRLFSCVWNWQCARVVAPALQACIEWFRYLNQYLLAVGTQGRCCNEIHHKEICQLTS